MRARLAVWSLLALLSAGGWADEMPEAVAEASAAAASAASAPAAPAASASAAAEGEAAAPDEEALPPEDEAPAVNPRDPYERLNRQVFEFNDKLDVHVLKPVAETYQKVVPSMVRTGVSNVLGNLGDVWSTVNQLLQGKMGNTLEMTMRVLTNTFFGMGGLFDQATELGMERRSEDFGQTLGRWGVPPGPYIVLPLLGPSDARDTLATPVDLYASLDTQLTSGTSATMGVSVLKVVNTRANLLGASQLLNEVALDRYSFLRDAYLARRRSQVYDGNPPDDDETP
ncbi:MlaA family lipoprotein [Ideonella benzenivorans]|uniref:MlaA family lipoprotein n=1 Tax=Ideonella benzenivorans TaxID=2831643 RepID=UPI001CED5BAF|nr:VacJ family lipoprotein [Ideonella benzenivorans]